MQSPKPIVFVSSTIVDLSFERQAAYDAIKKLKLVPRMSEFTFEAVGYSAQVDPPIPRQTDPPKLIF